MEFFEGFKRWTTLKKAWVSAVFRGGVAVARRKDAAAKAAACSAAPSAPRPFKRVKA
jgi:hypothetical protein